MAECRLPFSFKVEPRLPAVKGKRKRPQIEQGGDLPTTEPRVIRRRMGGANVTAQIYPPGNEQIHHLAHRDVPEVVQSCEDSTLSSAPLAPLTLSLETSRSANSSSAPLEVIKLPNQAIAPPRTEGECGPTLTEVNPEQGTTTGGARIWLAGMDFPSLFPLFARFGTAVVPTVSPLIICEALSN